MNTSHFDHEKLDTALCDRLAQLGQRPVDSSMLRQRLKGAIDDLEAVNQPRRLRLSLRAMLAAAAMVLLLVATSLMLINGSSPAVASPVDLAGLYRQVVAEAPANMTVHSVAAANRRIARQWDKAPSLPNHVPGNVSSCCLRHLHGKPIASVHLDYQGHAVSLLVAYSDALTSPMGSIVHRDGREFVVTDHEGLNMVMTHHDRRWLCVTSDLSRQQLLNLTAAIRF